MKSTLSFSSQCVETKLCKSCTSFTTRLHSLCGTVWYRTLRVNIGNYACQTGAWHRRALDYFENMLNWCPHISNTKSCKSYMWQVCSDLTDIALVIQRFNFPYHLELWYQYRDASRKIHPSPKAFFTTAEILKILCRLSKAWAETWLFLCWLLYIRATY